MRALAQDLLAGGPTAAAVADFDGIPNEALLSLRLACALHRAALDGRAPALRRYFPSTGGAYDPQRDAEGLAEAVREGVIAEAELIGDYLMGPPQTNDVGRCTGLLGGFLAFANEIDAPFDLLEIGCSAGLNLAFDRYHYAIGGLEWGDPASAVRLSPDWRGPPPALEATPRIRRRLGADIAPIDVSAPQTPARLASYVWPDQPDRLNRLLSAIEIARGTPRQIDRDSAEVWLKNQLATAEPGVGRLVFHSAMWLYLPRSVQDAVTAAIVDAGHRATADTPLGWLSLEPGASARAPQACEISLTMWPGGVRRVLGTAHTHGFWVQWNP